MQNKLKKFIKDAGAIRVILYIMAIITIVFKPDNSTTMNLEGLNFIPTLILPVISPMLITGFFLDMVMSKIYAAEQPEEIQKKFKLISRVDLALATIMLILWVPYLVVNN